MKLEFNINPVPASRPRVTRYGTYYGKKYKNFRKDIDILISKQDIPLIKGLYRGKFQFYVAMPISWSKKKRNALEGQYCDNNADLDNLLKAICDSLEGVAFENDRYMVAVDAEKRWAVDGKIEVELEVV